MHIINKKLSRLNHADIGIRIAKGIELYGGLSASIIYLVAQGIRAASAAGGPFAVALQGVAEFTEKISAGIMIVAGAATVTQRPLLWRMNMAFLK